MSKIHSNQINRREKVGIKKFKNTKALIDYSQTTKLSILLVSISQSSFKMPKTIRLWFYFYFLLICLILSHRTCIDNSICI